MRPTPHLCCRSCLSTDKPLLSLYDPIDSTASYLDGFERIAGCDEDVAALVALGQAAPETICDQCLDVLRIAYAFRKRCQRSAKTLLEQCQHDLKTAVVEWKGEDDVIGEAVQEEIMTIEILEEGNTTQDASEFRLAESVEECEELHVDEAEVEHKSNSSKPRSRWLSYHQNTEEVETTEETEELLDEDEELVYEDYLDANASSGDDVNDDDRNEESMDDAKEAAKRAPAIQLKCMKCEIVFDDRLAFGAHMKSEHDSSLSLLCRECGIFCTSSIALRRHVLEHIADADRTFTCDICAKSYLSRSGLVLHMEIHSGKEKLAEFLCSDCGKSFSSNQRLRLHSTTHSGERNFPCEFCDKKFSTDVRLRFHRRTHTGERPYHCNECGLQFAQGNALKCHMRIHTGEKPYKCEFCAKSFSQNTTLKTHMTLHTGKTVQCPDCDKKFSRPSYLILHRRTHSGEKPYKCTHCPNGYKQKSHLDRHIDTHLGVKHECAECGKVYSKQYTLKQHMRTHGDLANRPFRCEWCGDGFVRRDKFRAHLRTHAAEVDVDCKTEEVEAELLEDEVVS